MTTKTETIEGTVAEYVTAVIGGQLFGLPISRVQDVFMPERLTRVPLSSAEIAGVLNLRGRIVTVVDMRARLGLPKNDDGKPPMAVGVDLRGESYGLLIDQIGEVLKLRDDGREENPVNLDPRMAKLAGGVHRLDGQLMVVLDVEDGVDALVVCKRAMPEAILLDWNMPVMDGYHFLCHLRRMPGGDEPKVVFCTTENGIEHISQALEGGANEYIMKPFDKEIVLAKFQEVGLIALPE